MHAMARVLRVMVDHAPVPPWQLTLRQRNLPRQTVGGLLPAFAVGSIGMLLMDDSDNIADAKWAKRRAVEVIIP